MLNSADTDKLKAGATYTISVMIQHGSQEQISSMVAQGCLVQLYNALGTSISRVTSTTLHVILDAIEHVSLCKNAVVVSISH